MEIIAYLIIGGMIFGTLFFIIAAIVENNFDESHPIKKWWRKHIVAQINEDDDNF